MTDVSIGQQARVVVNLRDAKGDPIDVFDRAAGVEYTSSDPAVVEIQGEDDENPLDRSLAFLAEGTATLEIQLDGAPGPVERKITLRSEPINVHPEGAHSGEVVIELSEV